MSDPKSTNSAQRARHVALAEFVMKRGSVSMQEIVEQSGLSTMTSYRDVNALEEAGLLQRHRGRVTAVAGGLQEASASFRVEQEAASKEAIARTVAKMVPVGSSVVLDDSTSGVYVVRELAFSAPLTVITNSLLIARETTHSPALRLFLTGGSYQAWAEATLGPTALASLADIDADFCVLSASGILHGRCYHPYEDVVAVKRAMLRTARTKLLLLDHTKLRRKALHAFAKLQDFDHVIVDPGVTPEDLAQLRDWGANVIVGEDKASDDHT